MKKTSRWLTVLVCVAVALATLVPVGTEVSIAADPSPPSGPGGPVSPAMADVTELPVMPQGPASAAPDVPRGRDADPATYARLKREAATGLLPITLDGMGQNQDDDAPAPRAPQRIAAFDAIVDTGRLPPDGAIAVGDSEVLVAVNSSYAIYSKSGDTLRGATSFSSMFAAADLPFGTNIFDPRAVFDPASRRFFLVIAARNQVTLESWILLGISSSSSARGSWCTYSLDGSLNGDRETPYWADYPTLGIDDRFLYLGMNMFNWSGRSQYAKLRVLTLSQLVECDQVSWWDYWEMSNADGSTAYTIQPAVTFGRPGVEYFVNSNSRSGSFLTLWKLAGSLGSPLTRQTVSVNPYSIPPDARQFGTTTLIDTGDARLLNAVYANGSLWTGHTVSKNWGSGNVAAIRFYELRPESGAVRQQSTFGADQLDYYYPAIMPDSAGNVTIVFSRSGPDDYVSLGYTGRLAGDPVNSLQPSAPLRFGEDWYVKQDSGGDNRWGDYSAVALDADGRTVWIFGAYARSRVQGTSSWGTTIGAVVPAAATQTPTPTPTPTKTPTPTQTPTPTRTPTPIARPVTTTITSGGATLRTETGTVEVDVPVDALPTGVPSLTLAYRPQPTPVATPPPGRKLLLAFSIEPSVAVTFTRDVAIRTRLSPDDLAGVDPRTLIVHRVHADGTYESLATAFDPATSTLRTGVRSFSNFAVTARWIRIALPRAIKTNRSASW
ncbi:MAG: hypothetical protein HY331_14335 [Chloroflexi bacterium]|nr:hypothetical protein [Chloroflexota bacterium]